MGTVYVTVSFGSWDVPVVSELEIRICEKFEAVYVGATLSKSYCPLRVPNLEILVLEMFEIPEAFNVISLYAEAVAEA